MLGHDGSGLISGLIIDEINYCGSSLVTLGVDSWFKKVGDKLSFFLSWSCLSVPLPFHCSSHYDAARRLSLAAAWTSQPPEPWVKYTFLPDKLLTFSYSVIAAENRLRQRSFTYNLLHWILFYMFVGDNFVSLEEPVEIIVSSFPFCWESFYSRF